MLLTKEAILLCVIDLLQLLIVAAERFQMFSIAISGLTQYLI